MTYNVTMPNCLPEKVRVMLRHGLIFRICFASAWLVAALLFVGCDSNADVGDAGPDVPEEEQRVSDDDQELVRIAKNYLGEHRPEWADVDHLQPRVTERPDRWEVTWDLPPNVLGGTPVVYIDKDTREVTEVYHTQ